MSDVEAWVNKLSAMDPEDIRKMMVEEGIKGRPLACDRCPIALLLQAKSGEQVIAGYTYIAVRAECDFPWATSEMHDTPSSVIRFMSAFDGSQYPELLVDGYPEHVDIHPERVD